MAAIDSSSTFGYHEYKNKKWIFKHESFPAKMTYEDMRKYLIGKNYLLNDNSEAINVYCSKNFFKDNNSRMYIVELIIFSDHSQFILCSTFIDLIQLMNELYGYLNSVGTEETLNYLTSIKSDTGYIQQRTF